MGRYSFIGVLPRATVVMRDRNATILEDGGVRSVEYADPLDLLRQELSRYRRAPVRDLPRFSGGAVGYVAYEAARRFEHLPAAPREVLRLPEATFAIYDTVVCFDHVRHSLVVLAHDVDGERERAEERIARIFAALDAPLVLPERRGPVPRTVTANGTPEDYRERVGRARELIAEGDCIQIVLSQRFDVRPAPEPLALYRALRHVNPSPYMFLIEAAGATLVGASPEPFVRVEDGRIVMHPIAGTRPRGRDEAEDLANERELRASEKERAEHVMLVDLARNDIGRVSRPGTVRVRELMRVDRFSHVMHLTSVVDGELAGGLDALDAFRACFPAGTVSGAPKIRAMERIAKLEPDRRGPYAGAVGYVGFDQRMDTCIAIRTAVIADGVCRIQAGAGIVADSDPAAEEAETRAKARALLRAIELVDGLEDGR
jgi:anthranilate synthase component 1